jgi:hypothetical protein
MAAAPNLRKATSVLIVEAIESSLPFWQERLGFERGVEVPHENRLGFVILSNGSVEIMYQTIASLRADSAAHGAEYRGDRTFLFVEVEAIDAIAAALDGFDVFMPRRTTFYGSTEIGYREPGGHFVTFAQMQR